MVANGPDTTAVKSNTRMPASGPGTEHFLPHCGGFRIGKIQLPASKHGELPAARVGRAKAEQKKSGDAAVGITNRRWQPANGFPLQARRTASGPPGLSAREH